MNNRTFSLLANTFPQAQSPKRPTSACPTPKACTALSARPAISARLPSVRRSSPARRSLGAYRPLGTCGLLALAALAFAGCGEEKNTSPTDSSATAATRASAAQTTAHSAAHAHATPAAQSNRSAGASTNADGETVVAEDGKLVIESGDNMRYDITRFVVRPGQRVELTLRHSGRMPVNAMGHNVVILKKYTDVRAFAQAAARSAATDYIPRSMSTQVLAHTKMLGGGESDTITFTAPADPGEYDFICSFPAHLVAGMQGKMIVRRE